MAIGHVWLDMAFCTSSTYVNVKVRRLEERKYCLV